MIDIIGLPMRLYHCRSCDLWFEVDVDRLGERPARCPGCGDAGTVTPFDEREVVLAVVDEAVRADEDEEDGAC